MWNRGRANILGFGGTKVRRKKNRGKILFYFIKKTLGLERPKPPKLGASRSLIWPSWTKLRLVKSTFSSNHLKPFLSSSYI
jgi:hypothetical protein